MSYGVVFGVPAMLFLSSVIMALAWLGHLRFRDRVRLGFALLGSWLLVLPEYFLNVYSTRLGYGFYTGAQMATFNLCTGVVCVALVSRFALRERLSARQLCGFGLMVVGVVLVMYR